MRHKGFQWHRAVLVACALIFAGKMEQSAFAQSPPPAGRELMLGFIDKAITEGRLQSAGELILRAKRQDPGPAVELRAAEWLLAAGKYQDAFAAFQPLDTDAEIGPRAMAGRAVALFNEGHDVQADALLANALAINPDMARAWSIRGVLADRRRDWAAAEDFYGRALKADPENAGAWNNRGWSRILQGQHALAESDFQNALRLDPKLGNARTNLTLSQAMQGQYAKAFEGTEPKTLARDLNIVGVAAMLRGDHRVAEGYFSRAIDLNGRYDETAAANLAYLKGLAPDAPR